jgi:hypothetical protein
MPTDNLLRQLQRLRRHYENSLKTYDPISFLDFAHTLRIFADLSESKEDLFTQSSFIRPNFNKTFKKVFASCEYFYVYLPPEGVRTSAVATKELEGRMITSGPASEKFSVLSSTKIEPNGDLSIRSYGIANNVLSAEKRKALYDAEQEIQLRKVNFTNYMNAPAAHFRFQDINISTLSNKQLIQRVANEYEASHPHADDSKKYIVDAASPIVKKLMDHTCAQLPLPYFILLNIADTILNATNK